MSSACKPAGEGEEGMDAVMHAVVVEHKHVVFTSVIKIILRTDACPPPSIRIRSSVFFAR